MWCVRCNVRRYIPRCELVVTPLSRPLLCPRTTLMARAGMETVRLCGFACGMLRSRRRLPCMGVVVWWWQAGYLGGVAAMTDSRAVGSRHEPIRQRGKLWHVLLVLCSAVFVLC